MTPDADWKPSPESTRIRARLLDGTVVDYTELKVGDLFQAINANTGAAGGPG